MLWAQVFKRWHVRGINPGINLVLDAGAHFVKVSTGLGASEPKIAFQ